MKREKMQTARTKSGFIKHLRNNWMLYAMLLPVLLWYAIFCYLPWVGSAWHSKIISMIQGFGTVHGWE